MQTTLQRKFVLALALVMAGMFTASPVFAEKSGKHHQEWREEDRRGDDRGHEGHGHRDARDSRGRHAGEGYFDDHQRTVVREYYVERYHSGRCPPGLAKKHNGCQPYNYERGWVRGQPLPRSVVRYDLPPNVVVNLGAPPAGHKFVRVASDILLVAIGTGLVVDAIQDLDGR